MVGNIKDMQAETAINEYKPIIPDIKIVHKINILPPIARIISNAPGLIYFNRYVQINLLLTKMTIAMMLYD
tara:strand:- start:1 stop:213 length:213 start_codon:yes stop_codon:yes gene_type:complete